MYRRVYGCAVMRAALRRNIMLRSGIATAVRCLSSTSLLLASSFLNGSTRHLIAR